MTNSQVKNYRKVSLRLILVLPFVIQIFAAVGLVGYLSFKNGEKAVNDLASQLMQKVNRLVNQHLDTYLATPHQINQINLDATELKMLKLEDIQNSERYFWKQMQVFNIGYISFANPQGEFIGVERLDNRNLLINEVTKNTHIGKLHVYTTDSQGNRSKLTAIKNYDPRLEAWYTDPIKAGKPVWSKIYQWEDKPDIFSISSSYPLYDHAHKIIGVISVDLILSQISNFLADLQVSRQGKIFILERSGLIVASGASERPYNVINGKAQRLSALNSQDSLIRGTAQNLQQKFGSFRAIQDSQELDFILKGERQFVQIQPWRDKLGLDWLVVVVVPESDFMAQINNNTRVSIMLCLIALGWATVIGIYTSRWITKPILRLQVASLAIASGKLDQKVEIEGIDELESLAQSFNQMAAQLKTSFLELETRVAERTFELTAAKETADSANKAKSEFLANMSHELRTPLNGILGYAQILQRDQTTNPKQKDGINIIYDCASHLLNLINDILDLSKIEARKLELAPKDFHFPTFLKSIVDICRIRAEQKEITFTYQELNQLPTALLADEKRLRQVLINLLGNAIKFTDQGGVIFQIGVLIDSPSISNLSSNINKANIDDFQKAKSSTAKIRFQIEDTGIGMSSSQLQKIFLPFEQVGDKQRMEEGTGLGLAISQQIVEMMGGDIEVESVCGQGSKFWFDLDLQISEQWIDLNSRKSTHNIIGYEGDKKKILVVDDRWENRSVIVNMLQPLGFDLIEAINGQEGLGQAIVWHPHLIITDITMPVINGLEMTKQLRLIPQLQEIIIIASSASVFIYNQQQGLESGCNDFLPKPVQSDELLAQIQRYLGLSWIYEVGSTTILSPELENTLSNTSLELVVPPTEELQALSTFANIGDIAGVEQEALRLQQLDSKYMTFTDKLLKLTEELDEEAILKLIKQYI
ncbi:ATP-binding protein [Calothrix sp. PCC 7507]|uniref:ATP-binding protein n=1 Tax=Calothrix sp. PCC 7507 TaxID=99598 RepID=UPI00029F20ED|nr:ATP-binding protein [Calothrix sp. PCC 7507]AFY35095.1 Cache sensor hybrid histidine kinase [Calothrix sp. PCC 7507]